MQTVPDPRKTISSGESPGAGELFFGEGTAAIHQRTFPERKRKLPQWGRESKNGIFVFWGNLGKNNMRGCKYNGKKTQNIMKKEAKTVVFTSF